MILLDKLFYFLKFVKIGWKVGTLVQLLCRQEKEQELPDLIVNFYF